MAVDKNGKLVNVGAKVKVLRIDPRVTEFLPNDEIEDINSMLNDVLKVYEISENFIHVEKTWDRGNGRIESHTLPMSSNDIELIQ